MATITKTLRMSSREKKKAVEDIADRVEKVVFTAVTVNKATKIQLKPNTIS